MRFLAACPRTLADRTVEGLNICDSMMTDVYVRRAVGSIAGSINFQFTEAFHRWSASRVS